MFEWKQKNKNIKYADLTDKNATGNLCGVCSTALFYIIEDDSYSSLEKTIKLDCGHT